MFGNVGIIILYYVTKDLNRMYELIKDIKDCFQAMIDGCKRLEAFMDSVAVRKSPPLKGIVDMEIEVDECYTMNSVTIERIV
jgi:hypothetical protein